MLMSSQSISLVYRVLAVLMLAASARAVEISWERMPGKGKDISVGADGSVFVVGSSDGNSPVYRWNGITWENRGGFSVLIAVGPQGDPWVVDKRSNLAHFENGAWQPVVSNGSVTDVSVSTNGTVYVVGGRFCDCGQVFNETMYRLDGTNFVDLGLKGVVLHPAPDGQLWTVDAATTIHRGTVNNSGATIPGNALDLSVGANGDVWIIRRTAFDGYDGDVAFWNGTAFEYAGQFGARIAVAPDGTAWVITDDNRIYRGRKLRIQVAGAETVEGQELRFPVTLSGPASKVVTIDYRLLAPPSDVGTNSAQVATGRLTLMPGQTNAVIVYQVPNDTIYQGSRLYSLLITNASGANPPTGSINGRVRDDEPVPPTLSVAGAAVVTEGQTLIFPLTLLPAAAQDTLVTYQVIGPAQSPATNLGVLTTGTVVIAAGQTNANILFPVVQDTIAEPNRNYRLEILSAPGVIRQTTVALGPVLDDDAGSFALTITLKQGHLQVGATSQAGFEYVLQRRTQFQTTADWATTGPTLTGTGDEIVWDEASVPEAQSFYRVIARYP